MEKLFEIIFLDEAFEFLKGLDKKHYEKILFNIRKAQIEQNPKLFKKLESEIWEIEDSTKSISNIVPGASVQIVRILG